MTGSISGQQIDIESRDVTELMVRLHDDLIDLDQIITIRFNGETVFRGQVARRMTTMLRSLEERADPASVFMAEVAVHAR